MIDKKHWQAALDAQSAVNLSGVVHGMSLAMTAVWDETRELGHGTHWVNQHPITFLFAVAVGSLSRASLFCEDTQRYSKAYELCKENTES